MVNEKGVCPLHSLKEGCIFPNLPTTNNEAKAQCRARILEWHYAAEVIVSIFLHPASNDDEKYNKINFQSFKFVYRSSQTQIQTI